MRTPTCLKIGTNAQAAPLPRPVVHQRLRGGSGYALIIAVSLALALFGVGCGSDSPADGPSLSAGDSSNTSGDSSTLADGGSTDDVLQTDSGGGLCGDGTCDPAESVASCPLDCKSNGGSGTKGCLENKCKSEFAVCLSSSAPCKAFVACASACSSLGCVQACVQKGGEPDQVTKFVLQCGSKQQCFTQKPTCGDGTCDPTESAQTCPKDCATTEPVCGNGKCEKGETSQNCKKDCSQTSKPVCGNNKCEKGETANNCIVDCGGPDDPIGCVQAKCPSELKACADAPDCTKLLNCLSSCSTASETCFDKCFEGFTEQSLPKAFLALSQCGEKNCSGGSGGCGNGICEDGETPTNCKLDCKPPKPTCGDGKCESPQENGFTCPKDCQQTKPVCGNGKCEPQESALTCSKDCGTPQDVLKCSKDKCKSSYEKCEKSKGCNKALDCMAKCTSTQCLQGCALQAQGDFQTFISLAQCAQQAGCLGNSNSGPTCGDGKCEQGESKKNCPADCNQSNAGSCQGACGNQSKSGCWCDDLCEKQGDCCSDKQKICGAGPKCGDGKCESGENSKNCPKDCKDTKPVCGNGICEVPTETSKTCEKDCGAPPAKSCKSKSDCASSEVCCNKSQGTVCVPAGQCF